MSATEMAPKKEALVQELFDAAQWVLEVENEVDPAPVDRDGSLQRLAAVVGRIEAAEDV